MRPVVLMILDGWGYSQLKLGNAISTANTPSLDEIERRYPSLLLQASGRAVGLTWGEPGNSEVGHLTLGAGRTVLQYAPRIDRAIATGAFFTNESFKRVIAHTRTTRGKLHVIGLLTSGRVHATFAHLEGLLELAKRESLPQIYLHLIADGKDSGLREAPTLIARLESSIQKTGKGIIVDIIGRNYGMDRDHNQDRTARAYALWTEGVGQPTSNLRQSLAQAYESHFTDSTLEPLVVDPSSRIGDGDGIIFLNFREDSIQQSLRAFLDGSLSRLAISCMTPYLPDLPEYCSVAFPAPQIPRALAQVISENGLRQLHIAETQKFAHTTFFFNALRAEPWSGEEDILIPSLKDNHAHPEMRAAEIGHQIIQTLQACTHEFIVANFANADVLAHAGDLALAIRGAEAIDQAVGAVITVAREHNATVVITADHGNAEALYYRGTGQIETRHNINPVPMYLIAPEFERTYTDADIARRRGEAAGLLSDVAPTIIELLGLTQPEEMGGTSLLSLLTRS